MYLFCLHNNWIAKIDAMFVLQKKCQKTPLIFFGKTLTIFNIYN